MDIQKAIKSAINCLEIGHLKQAELQLKDILKVQPNNVSALHFIGVIYYQLKEYDSSIKYIKKALQLGPDYVDAYNNLGLVLQETNQLEEAIMSYEKALTLNPNFERAHYNLGTALKEKWQVDEAIQHYQFAIRLNPSFVEAFNNMGLALQDQGRLDEAEAYFRRALQIKPDFALCYSNLLLSMNYNSRYNAQTLFSEHLQFAKQCAEPSTSAAIRHKNNCSHERRLKIGYVSPDFRRHSVGYFIEPILAAHDHDQFELFCYSDVSLPDSVTTRLQVYSDQWQNIYGMTDKHVFSDIQKDGIDILVDLAGHTGNNRLLVFARKPAPVQITWMGYPNTTGISTINYRFVDGYTDPPGLTDSFYTEKLIRFPGSFLCYQPDTDSPCVEELPAIKTGHVTFGSFNYFAKVSPELVALWATLMKETPDSRLIMKSRNFSDRTTCKYAMELFFKHGIVPERIDLLPVTLSFEGHLAMYNRVDIALDTFPYNGTATTCEALWMGVPVITLAGNTHASRVGTSILSNVGLSDFIAHTGKEYIEIAVAATKDIPALQFLRKGLRNKMLYSPLCDKKGFIKNLEHMYWQIWRDFCKERSAINTNLDAL
jgi:protein O-GlcNAc transferase